MKHKEKFFFYSSLIFILCVHFFAYRVWLFSSGILSQGDWMLSLPTASKDLFNIPLLWKSYALGIIDITPPFYIFLFIEGTLSQLGISYGYIERILFMWPIALGTLPLSYLLIRSLTRQSIAALTGAVVYTYNTYFLIIQTGHLTLMMGFMLAPLVLWLLIKTLEKKSILYSVLTGVVAFIVSYYEFRAFYLVVLMAFFYYLYFLFVIAEGKILSALKRTFLFTFLPLVIVLLLNAYWILPLALASASGESYVFNRDLFGKEFFNISKAITLFHPFWNGGKYLPFVTQPIPPYFFLFPLFAFLGLYFNKKNKTIVFFGLLAIIGVFLTKQNNPPFPDVYYWLYSHVPGFSAFRESSKFYFFVALAYGVLIGGFVDWLWTYWKKGKKVFATYALTSLIILISLFHTKPLVMGEFGTLFVERTMPSDYGVLNSYIDSKNEFFRTLWVPVDSRWGTNTNSHPRVGIASLLSTSWSSFSDYRDYPTLGDQFIDFFKKEDTHEILNNNSIRYIIVPIEDTVNEDNFFPNYLKEKDDYTNALDQIPYLKKVNLDTKEIVLYENKTYRPHIYATNPSVRVSFQSINTTEYHITLTNISKPLSIIFTDTYHPDWQLIHKNKPLVDSPHKKTIEQRNRFDIDAETIKSVQDSTLRLTLYLRPQTFMATGSIISLTTAVILLVFFIGYGFTKVLKKK